MVQLVSTQEQGTCLTTTEVSTPSLGKRKWVSGLNKQVSCKELNAESHIYWCAHWQTQSLPQYHTETGQVSCLTSLPHIVNKIKHKVEIKMWF